MERMQEVGVEKIQFKTYEGMEHSATEEEIDDVCEWLGAVLPAH